MAEHPILFSTEMVKAILDGCKTQTRRVIKPQPVWIDQSCRWRWPVTGAVTASREWWEYADSLAKCPYGQPGDLLWVRETWSVHLRKNSPFIEYGADGHEAPMTHQRYDDLQDRNRRISWRPSIHMPRWASRITLKVTGVKVERVNDISEVDAKAEGINEPEYPDYSFTGWAIAGFAELWDKINEKRGYAWDSNPWVWVVEFKVI